MGIASSVRFLKYPELMLFFFHSDNSPLTLELGTLELFKTIFETTICGDEPLPTPASHL
jgi:hypothetical protein